MTTATPTKGECRFNVHEQPSEYIGNIEVQLGRVNGIMNVRTVAVLLPYAGHEEAVANGTLITDAFNTYTTTGLTPSELVQLVDSALDSLYDAVIAMRAHRDGKTITLSHAPGGIIASAEKCIDRIEKVVRRSAPTNTGGAK